MSEMSGRSLLHYKIVERIGAGGMGEVWRAWDTKLERDVAIKILPTDADAHSHRRERFLREARAASALIHPNIVTVHEINSDQGLDFIVMEYVRGTSLDAILANRKLTVRQTLGHAIQIADALATAHAAGVVHRDLKPGNIMVADSGFVKVLDFGLAKRMTSSPDSDITSGALTVEGAIMGTPAYMSPEQAVGGVVDSRSDLFSFGVVLYQMLAGQPPFQGESNVVILRQIVYNAPRPLADLDSGLPRELCDFVDRCLEKDAAVRYSDTASLVRDLRRISAALETATAATDSAPTIGAADPGLLRVKPRPRYRIAWAALAVLIIFAGVFALRGPVGEWLRPVPTATESTVDSLEGTPAELTQRSRSLLTRYDKRGFIDRAIQLAETALKQDSKFAPAYASLAQAYLRKGVGSSDKHWLNLASDSARQAVAANPDLAAAHEVMGAVLFEIGDLAGAQREVDEALKLDPRSGTAYVLLAKLTARSDRERAVEFYNKAVEFAPQDWVPFAEYGIFLYRGARFKEAADMWESATRIAPDNVRVLNNLAGAYHMLNDYERAASTLQAALQVDPSAATWNNFGTVRFFQGRYSDSVTAFENATKMDATNYQYWGNLGDAYRWTAGRRDNSFDAYAQAIRLVRERIARNPDDVEGRGRLALYLAKSGEQSGALEELERLTAAKNAGADASFKKAVVYEVLGRREPALTALGEAMRGGYSLNEIENDPELAALRADVRYQLLVSSLSKK